MAALLLEEKAHIEAPDCCFYSFFTEELAPRVQVLVQAQELMVPEPAPEPVVPPVLELLDQHTSPESVQAPQCS